MSAEKVETVYEGKFLRFLQSGKWEFVSRTKASGVVVVLPITRDGKMVLIEELRTAVGKRVIGLPAGLAGDEDGGSGEDLLVAAQRELLEETGYVSSKWRKLAEGPSSPGMTDELVTFFLAQDAVVSDGPGVRTDEGITVWVVELEELSAWLEEKQAEGKLVEYKIFAGLWWWKQSS
jgi:ADP-ribose pyrophosphatase